MAFTLKGSKDITDLQALQRPKEFAPECATSVCIPPLVTPSYIFIQKDNTIYNQAASLKDFKIQNALNFETLIINVAKKKKKNYAIKKGKIQEERIILKLYANIPLTLWLTGKQ